MVNEIARFAETDNPNALNHSAEIWQSHLLNKVWLKVSFHLMKTKAALHTYTKIKHAVISNFPLGNSYFSTLKDDISKIDKALQQ